MISWCTIVVLFCALPSSEAALITVDRIFGSHEFDVEKVAPFRWSKRSTDYFTLETPPVGGKGRNFVRNASATGKREIIVSANDFIPAEKSEPIELEAFELSTDESKLLIFTKSKRVWRRNTRGDYWVMDLANRELKQLGGDAKPSTLMFCKFSPDGTRVAYVCENNLYVQDLKSLRITALTTNGSATLINGTSDWVNEEELGIRDGYRWSPDGKSIVFWQFNTSGVTDFHLLDNTATKDQQIKSFPYPKVGETNSATRLGVVSASGGEVRWLHIPGDPREHYLPHVEWTPDGTQLLVQQFNRLQTENRVLLADPKSGETRLVFTESDAAWLENENPVRWVNDGKDILWLSERDGWRHAYIASLDGHRFVPVTQGQFDVMSVEAVDAHAGWLYFAASPDNATQRYLYRTRLDGGTPERLSSTAQPGWHTYDFSPDAKWAVHTYSNFATPPVVELIHLPDSKVARVLTDNHKLREKLAELKQPTTAFLNVDIGDGLELDAWCIRPPDFDSTATSKYPLLIHVYGEPHGQMVKDMWGGERGIWHRMLAQQGCVVASIDNRGTMVPRGREWRRSVHRQIGIIAPKEQAAAVRALLQEWPSVDAARVGVWGWSGGGSMSLNAIFHYPDLYRTAIAVAPNADQLLYDSIYQERYMGLPKDNADNYRDGSPLTHVRNLQGNLLVVHGTGDDNGHYQGTEMLINELIAHNKQFTVMPYPNRSHAISEGSNTIRHFWGLLTRYLQENLLDESAAKKIANPPAVDQKPPQSKKDLANSETRAILGWTVHINPKLLTSEANATARALELLQKQLEEIIRELPMSVVVELQKVPLYFSPAYTGKRGGAEYHPNAAWLRNHGRDPAMAKCVEFTNIANFEQEMHRMPNFALHELAHAYHHRELPNGYEHPEIKAAYEKAKASGKYDSVLRRDAEGRTSTDRAYALSSPMEYFAETSEAFFSRNDFFPFTREELQRHDPEMFELLREVWRVESLPK